MKYVLGMSQRKFAMKSPGNAKCVANVVIICTATTHIQKKNLK